MNYTISSIHPYVAFERETITTKYRIRDASGGTMFVFGVLALLLGLVRLLHPELLLSLLGFTVLDRSGRVAGDYTLVFMISSSMASFNIGIGAY